MTLKERYEGKSTKELVEIMDSPTDYTPQVLDIVKVLIYDRKIDSELLKSMAFVFNRKKARKQFEHLDPLNDEIEITASEFLTEEELRPIYADELNAFIQDQDGFRFNVWLYALGG